VSELLERSRNLDGLPDGWTISGLSEDETMKNTEWKAMNDESGANNEIEYITLVESVERERGKLEKHTMRNKEGGEIQEALMGFTLNQKTKSKIIARVFPVLCTVFMFCTAALVQPVYAARIKELGYINGVRSNQLIGYGLIVGLNGTGDKSNTLFTNQSLANMLESLGVKVNATATKVNNIAGVMVTANLPPYAKVGNKVDITVSSIGDAKSIEGGILMLTQLKGADGETYAIAQGAIVTGGYLASGQGATVQKNHPTVGRIANGASIEREISYESLRTDAIMIALKEPDFTTARRVAERINDIFAGSSYAKDGGTVTVTLPGDMKANPVKFLSIVENLDVKPDTLARIIVDEKTGTVVIGENVRISTVAISHGNLSIQIKEDQKVSQPLPFAKGETVATPDTAIKVEEEKGRWYLVEGGITIRELVKALNATGISTRDIITILQTIKASGALHADLEVI
jgi:flagellar P-ring protein precursor FlgI